MHLVVYKGFPASFLEDQDIEPLIPSDIQSKKDILSFSKKQKR